MAGAGAPPASPGRPPTVAAVLDVGTNSVLLLVVAVDAASGGARRLAAGLATTRLGAGLRAGGRLDDAAKARTRTAVLDAVTRARAAGATHVWAFATGAARRAADGEAFAEALAADAGVPVAVLSGAEEAALAWAAARGGLDVAGPCLVADVGGGTTELTLGEGPRPDAAASLALGALALTERHGGDAGAMRAAIDAALAGTDVLPRARRGRATVVASGGSATALAALDLGLATYDPARVHGHALAVDRIGALAARVRDGGPHPGLDPDRAAILPAGALVLTGVAAAAGAGVLRVSDLGVRHAYLAERLAAGGVRVDLRSLVA